MAAEREVANLTAWASYLGGYIDLHALELKSAARHLGRAVEQRYILDTRAAVDALAASSAPLGFVYEYVTGRSPAFVSAIAIFAHAALRRHWPGRGWKTPLTDVPVR